ncbi:hypothetical protein [uncultured Ruegeria sp.]|uniref:hypothetical protein n=1 Tax=uncultured Ruegeria sp. TaxID=259304 RepID=UPI002605B5B6|nr:hypothetical protein [uncultured Ruegeria sp.]
MLDFNFGPIDPNGFSFDDFPAIAPLELIASDLGINLTLFGGAASRALMHKIAGSPDEKATLFDLAPFSSDFDLSHDGDKEVSSQLRKHIADDVPFASWFRWSILDGDQSSAARRARFKSTNVPLRRIEIGNHGNSRIPQQALVDIGKQAVSYNRNPAYEDSALAQNGRDVEFFGFMLALNALLDMREIFGSGQLEIGKKDMAGWLSPPSLTRQFELFDANPHLATRFWNLFTNLVTRAGSELMSEFPVLESVRQIAAALPQMGPLLSSSLSQGRGFATSRVTATGEYRSPNLTPQVLTGSEAQQFSESFLKLLPAARQSDDRAASMRLDPAFELIAAVPTTELKPYALPKSKREDYDPYYSAADEEFLEIAWVPDPSQALNPNGITACMIPYPDAFNVPYTFDVPAVGGVFSGNRPWVRIRLDDLLQHGPNGKTLKVAILILQVPPEDPS